MDPSVAVPYDALPRCVHVRVGARGQHYQLGDTFGEPVERLRAGRARGAGSLAATPAAEGGASLVAVVARAGGLAAGWGGPHERRPCAVVPAGRARRAAWGGCAAEPYGHGLCRGQPSARHPLSSQGIATRIRVTCPLLWRWSVDPLEGAPTSTAAVRPPPHRFPQGALGWSPGAQFGGWGPRCMWRPGRSSWRVRPSRCLRGSLRCGRSLGGRRPRGRRMGRLVARGWCGRVSGPVCLEALGLPGAAAPRALRRALGSPPRPGLCAMRAGGRDGASGRAPG